MPLAGKAAVAMWWNMAAAQRDEFEHWHSHEHFPERMGIPGFLRGSRWSALEGDGFFVMYELDDYATLTSDAYLARLNAPSPWSTRMMPHHRDMVRSQCRVSHSAGGGIGRFLLTVRVSPQAQGEAALSSHLASVAALHADAPGGVACHLLRTETPRIAATTEQKIRGGADAAADWIVLACGYRDDALHALQAGALSADSLAANGAAPGTVQGHYQLSYAASAADLRGVTLPA